MDVFISAIILAFFNVFGSNCEILRLPCKSYANFSIIKHDYALEGSVIKTLHFVSENQCKSGCMMTPGCKSYNKEIDGDQRCELNNKTTEDKRDVATIVSRSGWIFGSTDFKFHLLGKICEEKDPCPEGVMCRDTCECPGYKCYPCKHGTTGLRCEEDACASNPCRNNGTCVNGVTFFTCTCAPGYTGPTCSTVIACHDYTVLNETYRAVTYIDNKQKKCDKPMELKWYRFSGDAGIKMVEACPTKLFVCSTDIPGWLNGQQPSVEEGEVERTTCWSYLSNCCSWNTTIKVRNCGDFFVYHFGPPPVCYAIYCGSGTSN